VRATPITTRAELLASLDEVRRDPMHQNRWYVVRKAKAMGLVDELPPEWRTEADKITTFRNYTEEDRHATERVKELVDTVVTAVDSATEESAEDLTTLAASIAWRAYKENLDQPYNHALQVALSGLVKEDRLYEEDVDTILAALGVSDTTPVLGQPGVRRIRTAAGALRYHGAIGDLIEKRAGKWVTPNSVGESAHPVAEIEKSGEAADRAAAKTATRTTHAFQGVTAGQVAELVHGGKAVHVLGADGKTRKVVGAEHGEDEAVRLHLGPRMGENEGPTVALHSKSRLFARRGTPGERVSSGSRGVRDDGEIHTESAGRPGSTGGTMPERQPKTFRFGKNLNNAARRGDVKPGDTIVHDTGTKENPRPARYNVNSVKKDKHGATHVRATPVSGHGNSGGHSNIGEDLMVAREGAEMADPRELTEFPGKDLISPDRVMDVADRLHGGDKGGGSKGPGGEGGTSGGSSGGSGGSGGGGSSGASVSPNSGNEVHAKGGGGGGSKGGSESAGTKDRAAPTTPGQPSRSDPTQAQLFRQSPGAKFNPRYIEGGGNNPVPNALGDGHGATEGDRIVTADKRTGTIAKAGSNSSWVKFDDTPDLKSVKNAHLSHQTISTDKASAA